MSGNKLITEDFLLESEQAQRLYHEYAANMPIIDYHCHLPPVEIAEDQRWENISQVWLAGDHYKWRAMRSNGVPEKYCTGDASDREKFTEWAETVPCLLRNPLYHWTHLELRNYFGISDRLISPESADYLWDATQERMRDDDFSARGLIKQSNVKVICTTDDPTDSLEYHAAIAADSDFDVKVLPAWRPDKGMAADKPTAFNAWIEKLEEATDTAIGDFDTYLAAVRKRHDFFHQNGCRLSDHGIETFPAVDYTRGEIENIFTKLRAGSELGSEEVDKFKAAMLQEFALMNAEKGWVQQYHYGCMRNNNSRMFAKRGADIGFDSIGDFPVASAMSRFFDALDSKGSLAKTIIYNLNPRDNELVASMLGNFQDGTVPGKMQMGSGWWFLDNIDGMQRQMEALSRLGLLSRFVGMLTDSRSFLSYARHEYFRRLLCNLLGSDMARGLIPNDLEMVGKMVQDISYNNANRYFGF